MNVAAACENQDLQLVQKLIRENGQPVNEEGGSKNIHGVLYASANGNVDLVSFLISSGCTCSCSDAFKTSPLHYAARLGFTDICQRMVTESDANINASDKNLTTPLHLAAHYGHRETCSFLIKSGADPMRENVFGEKPIDLVIAGMRRRSNGLFDGSERVDDLINFAFTIKNINRVCIDYHISPKQVLHLADSVYMLNLQMILDEINRAMSRNNRRFGKRNN